MSNEPREFAVERVTLATSVTGLLVGRSLRMTLVIAGEGLSLQLPPTEARQLGAILIKLADQREASETASAVDGANAWAQRAAGNA